MTWGNLTGYLVGQAATGVMYGLANVPRVVAYLFNTSYPGPEYEPVYESVVLAAQALSALGCATMAGMGAYLSLRPKHSPKELEPQV